MGSLLPFLKARLQERSSRIQLVTLVLLGAVAAGLLSVEQVTDWTAKIVALVAVVGPLAGVLVPDNNSAVDAAAKADLAVQAAVEIATDAAEKAAGPGAREVSLAVTAAAEKLGL